MDSRIEAAAKAARQAYYGASDIAAWHNVDSNEKERWGRAAEAALSTLPAQGEVTEEEIKTFISVVPALKYAGRPDDEKIAHTRYALRQFLEIRKRLAQSAQPDPSTQPNIFVTGTTVIPQTVCGSKLTSDYLHQQAAQGSGEPCGKPLGSSLMAPVFYCNRFAGHPDGCYGSFALQVPGEKPDNISDIDYRTIIAEAKQKAKQEAYEEVAAYVKSQDPKYVSFSEIRSHFCKPKERVLNYVRKPIEEWASLPYGDSRSLELAKGIVARLSKEGNRD